MGCNDIPAAEVTLAGVSIVVMDGVTVDANELVVPFRSRSIAGSYTA